MANNFTLKYRFYIVVVPLFFVLLSIIGIVSFNYYLDEYASSFSESFRLQNTNLIEAGEVLELSSRLEATKRSGSIVCIFGFLDGRVFYQYGPKPCNSTLLSRLVTVRGLGNNSLDINFQVKLPWNIQTAYIGFSLLNILVALILIGWIRSFENQKQLTQAYIARLATQVAHDIRSPLSALNMVLSSINNSDDEKKEIAGNSIKRINEIANNLLLENGKIKNSQGTNSSNKNINSENNFINLHKVINVIASEKQSQYRSFPQIIIKTEIEDGLDLISNIMEQDLLRCLSNLINNSIESFEKNTGTVTISLRGTPITNFIVIFDNGKGIPPEMLPLVGQLGFTLDKENGNGLGLNYAKKVIESASGEFILESRLGVGTMITIKLPRVNTNPKQFS